jgi:hypothetical protein
MFWAVSYNIRRSNRIVRIVRIVRTIWMVLHLLVDCELAD